MAVQRRQASRAPRGIMTQRNVNRVVDAGIGLATIYVGISALGAVKGALK